MSNKLEELKSAYSGEWNSILHDISQIRQGFVHEVHHKPGYPSLAKQADKIEDKLNDLLKKVANDLPSDTTKIFE